MVFRVLLTDMEDAVTPGVAPLMQEAVIVQPELVEESGGIDQNRNGTEICGEAEPALQGPSGDVENTAATDAVGVGEGIIPAFEQEITPTSRRKGKRRKPAKKKPPRPKKEPSSVKKPPRKRKPSDTYTTSARTQALPRRSSNRLKQKQEAVDYSRLPPKYHGLPKPSMRFCDYVINELLAAKYQPINWLIELPTVKKKLKYRQYGDADEFANEIRTLCMNPIDNGLMDECLALLHVFDQLAANQLKATESLLTELDSKQALLRDVQRRRREAWSTGAEMPRFDPSLKMSLEDGAEQSQKAKTKQTVVTKEEVIPDTKNEDKNAPMTLDDMDELAEEIKKLNTSEIDNVIRTILNHHTIEIPDGDEELVAIPIDRLAHNALKDIRSYVTELLATDRAAVIDVKTKKKKEKKTSERRRAQPVKKRVSFFDVEARKKELVEGIKKLGGTGTTRPIKKQSAHLNIFLYFFV
ncbi:unnamed protein product [Nippostrongylus brasiliensis]|uniref:NET domain-containing protein n=1 Tax=Nippostrongylus brasiliensis TaxID=27835 RepID=A0A0N4Y018_NIPBR|nr:unnamed protein product [Nippostrongylus brasiliensis]